MRELTNRFRQQVSKDNEEFGVRSIYVPNPILCAAPDYCIVAMEPSLVGKSPDQFQALIESGFTNFLYSAGDFILHYCAFRYLCDEAFGYYVTDISKGAMSTSLANEKRVLRYERWIGLLRDELNELGNPKLFAVGRLAESFLKKNGFAVEYLIHYSTQNAKTFADMWKHRQGTEKLDMDQTELAKFSRSLLNSQGYDPELAEWIMRNRFKKPLSPYQVGMIAYYRDRFLETK